MEPRQYPYTIIIILLVLGLSQVMAFADGPDLTYPTPAPIDDDLDVGTDAIDDALDNARTYFDNSISATLTLSNSLHTAIAGTDSITASTVPDTYAPTLPREIAQIGWQFEAMSSDLQRRYSLVEWTSFFAQIVAVPVKLAKSLFVLGRYLGPLGLFLGWLFVMLPMVLLMKTSALVKNLVTSAFNFMLDIIRFVLDVIKLIPGL